MNLVLLIGAVFMTCLGLLAMFYRANSKLREQHALRAARLQQKQLLAIDQMRLRDKRLANYRFTDRNLKEVLIAQSGISL